ncbi:cell division protein FtsQ/DivIB [Staphylococcus massiliensis]|uniref:cell division protein FtsQ/DivIB n=1 Tax=Staphylococcus massiliensis TaxID=555791 RepID=UPI003990613F
MTKLADRVKPINNDYIKEKRRKQRKRRKQIQLGIILGLLFIVGLILIYMFTPLSKISNVEIKGNHFVSKSYIEDQLDVKNNARMYTFDAGKTEQKIKDHDLVKDAEMKKSLPNTLKVNVNEYDVVGLVKHKDKYVPLLENGGMLKDYKDKLPTNVPVLEGFQGEKRDRIAQALSEMKPNIRSLISEVSYQPEATKQNKINLFMKDNLQVVGEITTIADKMKYYPKMSNALEKDESGKLKQDGFIDLSVGATFIPYENIKASSGGSETDKEVKTKTQAETEAKDELQNALNQIKQDTQVKKKEDKAKKDGSKESDSKEKDQKNKENNNSEQNKE